MSNRGAVITGWGTALPDKTVTNADLAARLDTNDEWIVARTGIHERRVGGTTAGLATEAGRAAMERAIQKLPIRARFVVRSAQEEVQV